MPWRHKGSRTTSPFILKPRAKLGECAANDRTALALGVELAMNTEQEAEWNPESIWMSLEERKFVPASKQSPVRPGYRVVTILTALPRFPGKSLYHQFLYSGRCSDSAVCYTATTVRRTSEPDLNFKWTGSTYTSVDVVGNHWILIKAFYNLLTSNPSRMSEV